MQNHPIVRLAIPFILGMSGTHFLCRYGALDAEGLVLPLGLLAAVVAVLQCILYFGPSHNASRPSAFGGAVAAFFCLLGALLMANRYAEAERQRVPEGRAWCCVVDKMPQRKARSWAVQAREEGGAQVLLYLQPSGDGVEKAFREGDTLVVLPKFLRLSSPFRKEARNEDEAGREYLDWLYYSGVSATAYVPVENVLRVGRAAEPGVAAWLSDMRRRVSQRYAEGGIDGEGGAIVEAMTTGNRSALTPAQREAFSRSGASPMIALSGFHLGVIVGLLHVFFLNGFLPLRWRRALNVVTVCVVWAYVALAGAPVSLVRAAVMFSFMSLAMLLGRRGRMLNACALSAFILLLVNPFALLDVGFQLSYIAVTAIFVFVPLFDGQPDVPRWRRTWLFHGLLVGAVATLASLPLATYYFGRVPFYGIFVNLLMSVMAFAMLYVAALWWMFCWWDEARRVLGEVLCDIGDRMNGLSQWVAGLPRASLDYRPTLLETFLLSAVSFSLMAFVRWRHLRLLQLCLLAAILFCLALICIWGG